MKEEKLLRKPIVLDVSGLTHSTLYYLMKEGSFPQPVKLGKRTVAWKKSEIDEWINTRERSIIKDQSALDSNKYDGHRETNPTLTRKTKKYREKYGSVIPVTLPSTKPANNKRSL